jgi:hypothetical protein
LEKWEAKFKGAAISVAKNWDSRIRESHGYMHFGIGNPETLTSDRTEVMRKMFIWARILARRDNV